jgi:large subunit ribosomal protein L31e
MRAQITADLNKFVWSKGIRNVPVRVRVTLTRRRNDDEDAKEKMYTLVDHKPVGSDSKFTGLQTLVVEDADE